MERRKSIRGNEQAAVRLPRERLDLILYLARSPHEGSDRLDLELRGGIGKNSKIIPIMWRGFRVHQESDAGERRRNLFEHAQPFAHHRRLEKKNPLTLPPGWAKLSTYPAATGSETPAKTMGIVRVSRSNATSCPAKQAKITSGEERTSSAA